MGLGPGTPPHWAAHPPSTASIQKAWGLQIEFEREATRTAPPRASPHTCGESLDMPNPAGEAWEVGGSIDVCILAVI